MDHRPDGRNAVATVIAFLSLAAFANGCRCGKEPSNDAPRPAFTVGGVSELDDLRRGAADFLVAAVRADGRSEVMSVDDVGRVRWRSAPVDHALLGASAGDPIFVVDAEGGTAGSVKVIDATTGSVVRSFPIDDPAVASESWLREGTTLYAIEPQSSSRPTSLRAVDVAGGRLLWQHEPAVGIETNTLSHPTLAVFTTTSMYVFCTPERNAGSRRDLCRFARADGGLTTTYAGPVIDVAAGESPAKRFFVLREDSVEALSEDGVVAWKHSLSDGYRGDRVVAGRRWIAVMATAVRSKSDYQEQLIALDATDGHELFMKDSGAHGEHYQSRLAIGDEQLVFLSNITPNVRVVDNRGNPVFGAPLTTQFVVATEVVGGFVEPLRGNPFLVPPFLALPRKEKGLEVYRLPLLRGAR